MSAASDENQPTDLSKTSGEAEIKGVKRSAEEPELDVHTANDWEHAKLDGGDERKMKFLRLMGAGKKESSVKAPSTESEVTKKHGRSDQEEQELKSRLEKQFETNLEYKLTGGARRHKGLGFSEEEQNKEEKPKETTVNEKSEADSSTDKESDAKTDGAKDTKEKEDQEKEKGSDEKKDQEKEKGSDEKKDQEKEKGSEEEKTDSAKKGKFAMSFVKASS